MNRLFSFILYTLRVKAQKGQTKVAHTLTNTCIYIYLKRKKERFHIKKKNIYNEATYVRKICI